MIETESVTYEMRQAQKALSRNVKAIVKAIARSLDMTQINTLAAAQDKYEKMQREFNEAKYNLDTEVSNIIRSIL